MLSMACLSFLIPEQTDAETITDREIQLQREHDKADLRSVFSIHAHLNGRTVYISSNDQYKIVSVVITDTKGDIVVADTYLSSQVISISVSEEGKYRIKIYVGAEVFTGGFELK